jgi:hypothetical protein
MESGDVNEKHERNQRSVDAYRRVLDAALPDRHSGILALFALEFTRGIAPLRLLPLLWGRIKEGGRSVLCNKGAAAHPTTACATPHP